MQVSKQAESKEVGQNLKFLRPFRVDFAPLGRGLPLIKILDPLLCQKTWERVAFPSRASAETVVNTRGPPQILWPNPHRTHDATQSKWEPVDVNGSVHTARNQHQRICIRFFRRVRPVWIGLDLVPPRHLETLCPTLEFQHPCIHTCIFLRKGNYG